jgi:arsenate reductase (thioredoxin)
LLYRSVLLLLLLLLQHPLMGDKVVLFVCVGNAGRSLMAESIFNAEAPLGWRALSAGTRPAAAVNPRTRTVLEEQGFLLPDHPPQLLTEEMMVSARLRITMGCLDDASCPARLKTLDLRDWALPDTANLDVAGFRAVRDQIRTRVDGLRREIALADRPEADRTLTH